MGPQRKPNTRNRTFPFLTLDPLFFTVSIANVDDRITVFSSEFSLFPQYRFVYILSVNGLAVVRYLCFDL